MPATLEELARLVGGTVEGDGRVVLQGVNGLREAGPGEIAFLANPRYASLLPSTRASAVILGPGPTAPLPVLRTPQPDLAFARVAAFLHPPPPPPAPGVHPAAVVSPRATLGRDVVVGPGTVVEDGASVGDRTVLLAQVYVGPGARIGPDSLLYPQVVVRDRCEVGARVILHSGAVVGADGFGFTTEGGVHHKIPQTGIVVIEDDVESGANTTIDRARFGRTVVGRGTKIDNLVQVAHNVVIGPGCLIAAQAGISGSTRLGSHVMLGGQAGLAGHVELGDRSVVTAKCGVAGDVPPGAMVAGERAWPLKPYMRQLAVFSRLPELQEELRRLRREVEDLRRPARGS